MITVYNTKHLTWNNNVSVNYYELFVDTASELPATLDARTAITGEGHMMAQGSIAWVISTGKPYMLDSTYTWVLQGS